MTTWDDPLHKQKQPTRTMVDFREFFFQPRVIKMKIIIYSLIWVPHVLIFRFISLHQFLMIDPQLVLVIK